MRKAELKKRAFELHQQDYSFGEIATELNKPRQTVYRWVKSELKNQLTADGVESDTDRYSSGAVLNINETNSKQTSTVMANNLHKKVCNDTGNTPNPAEVALKKADNDHELRMKDHENNKQKELLQSEVDKLLNLNNKLQKDNKRLSKRYSLLINLQNITSFKVQLFRGRNSELEEEVSLLCDPTYVPDEEMDNPSIPASFVDNIAKMIQDYLELDGTNCNTDTFGLTIKLAEVLKSEIRNNAIDYGINLNDDMAMIILNKFIKDLKSKHSSLQEASTDDFKLIINRNSKLEMVSWLKTYTP